MSFLLPFTCSQIYYNSAKYTLLTFIVPVISINLVNPYLFKYAFFWDYVIVKSDQ